MGEAFTNFLIENKVDIIKDIIIGLLCGVIFIPRSNNPQLTNHTSLPQASTYIKQLVINDYSKKVVSTNRVYPRKSNDDESILGLYVALGVILTFFFIRFHSQILDIYSTFTLITLSLVLTVSIKLYRNNQYDHLNRIWTFQMLCIIAYNFVHISLMSKQDISNLSTESIIDFINSVGLEGIAKFGYDALGFFLNLLPNLMLIMIIIHMFATNIYLTKGGSLPLFVLRKTLRFSSKPFQSACLLFFICGLSFLFSSGLAYDFISSHTNHSPIFTQE